MSCALRLADGDNYRFANSPDSAPLSTLQATLGYSLRPSTGASNRSSLRPTLSSRSRATTLVPALAGSFPTEPPTTQRSATVHPRFEAAGRHETTNLLAVMRLNLDFLQSLLQGQASSLAAGAIADLHQTLDGLERRLIASASGR